MVASNRVCPKARRLVELNFAKFELLSYEDFRNSVLLQQECSRLTKLTGIDDSRLLNRLVRHGFGVETIDALILFPIAKTAWASGYVDATELDVAEKGIQSLVVYQNKTAIELFRSWMRKRPNGDLCNLWKDYICERVHHLSDEQRNEEGNRVLQISTEVAAATGGLLGVRAICAAERKVLDQISSIYALSDTLSVPLQASSSWWMAEQLRV